MDPLKPESARSFAAGQCDDEIFDVVDERDIPIGRATRREVHTRGLWHRAVHVLVFNKAGQVFIQKRSMAKDTAPGCWDSSCSGHLDCGEDYDAAAVRELKEELGLKLEAGMTPVRLIYLKACQETGNEFVWVYRCHAEGPFNLNPAELEGGAWIMPKELMVRMNGRPHEYSRAFRYLWANLPDKRFGQG